LQEGGQEVNVAGVAEQEFEDQIFLGGEKFHDRGDSRDGFGIRDCMLVRYLVAISSPPPRALGGLPL
jgi:hypothetical protein